MTGFEESTLAVARQSWEMAKEGIPHVRDLVSGRVPANDAYIARRLDDLHKEFIAANRVSLELLKAKYREEA